MPGRTLSLPPFSGATRRIVLTYVAVFFALALFSFALPRQSAWIGVLALVPDRVVHGWLWQLLTYTFVPSGVLNTAFALLTIWFFGAVTEQERGSRWLTELFYGSVIGGAVLTTLIAFLPIPSMHPALAATGAWSAAFATLVAFGMLNAEQEIIFFFVLRMKAKYLVAIYVLIDLAWMVRGEDVLSAVTQLASGLCAYLFVRYAPRRGMAFGMSERYFSMRNSYYRWKRRRAARKFEVYMRKQNREVHFDAEGRYISPDEEKRDPKNRKWMN
ncbi:MAG: rhomboid family intramembrane serine protease [Acidobacteria bacterium]|nr:rhomboid family intramembrane serine protease [Acidobacteriota bacterium]